MLIACPFMTSEFVITCTKIAIDGLHTFTAIPLTATFLVRLKVPIFQPLFDQNHPMKFGFVVEIYWKIPIFSSTGDFPLMEISSMEEARLSKCYHKGYCELKGFTLVLS